MKLKQKVSELQKEALRIEKLIKIAKPTSMPALKMPNSSGSLSKTKTLAPKSGVMIGKRFGFGAKNKIRTLDPNAPKTVIKVAKLAAFDDANEREERKTRLPINLEDEPEQASIPDEEDTKPPSPKKMMGLCLPESLKPVETNPPVAPSFRDKFASPDPIPKLSEDNDTKVPVDRFNPLPEASDDGNVGDDGEDVPETEPEPKKRKNRGRKRRGPASDIDHTNDGDIDDSSTVVPGDYDDSLADEKYATWMPPQGQSGDGRTNLNDKLGY